MCRCIALIHLLLVCFKKKMQQSKITASSTQVLGPSGPEPEFCMSKDKPNLWARQLTLPITLKGSENLALWGRPDVPFCGHWPKGQIILWAPKGPPTDPLGG